MLELSSLRKNKVNLEDYDCDQDIKNRILMSDFTMLDIEVLEEILYSPLKIPFKRLLRNVDCNEGELLETLNKLTITGLLEHSGDLVLVDKEKRKYFEFEINRFSDDFKPDMEFLQGLLKKVPIHVLPNWYSIPRTSNNIFESIVEKYLFTPHIYQRYLMELNLGDPTIDALIQEVFESEDLKVSSTDLISKYNLKREAFEEMMLILEFNFVCCVVYEKQDDHWLEYITPFHEWSEFLRFNRETELLPIKSPVERAYLEDFGFIEEMSQILRDAKAEPIPHSPGPVVDKLALLKFIEVKENSIKSTEAGLAWLDLNLENRSLHLYRHPCNRILSLEIHERYVREAEKSVKRVLNQGWVFFDDFLKGVQVPLNEESVIMLKKEGKHWKYQLPIYGQREHSILRATIFEWLFELGMVNIGTSEGRECFSVTPFGRFFFNS